MEGKEGRCPIGIALVIARDHQDVGRALVRPVLRGAVEGAQRIAIRGLARERGTIIGKEQGVHVLVAAREACSEGRREGQGRGLARRQQRVVGAVGVLQQARKRKRNAGGRHLTGIGDGQGRRDRVAIAVRVDVILAQGPDHEVAQQGVLVLGALAHEGCHVRVGGGGDDPARPAVGRIKYHGGCARGRAP